ncbi:uncharacterized protein LOC132902306 [Amyelois transitella]|uniref:uncharacterized protein LOC132902306 n=1 Tax=Amyelois transitella TaxID=680683 RepID=UPI00298FB5E2|nr:uncharacterized protein LOC132902306 [Amyelois transitella]XP_060802836.1 uncharacterized protein LOC132902306 [Amyelois transitella]
MCTNEALVESLECYMDEILENFQDFVKKSLVLITVAIGSLVGILLYILKSVNHREVTGTSGTNINDPNVTGYSNNATTFDIDQKPFGSCTLRNDLNPFKNDVGPLNNYAPLKNDIGSVTNDMDSNRTDMSSIRNEANTVRNYASNIRNDASAVSNESSLPTNVSETPMNGTRSARKRCCNPGCTKSSSTSQDYMTIGKNQNGNNDVGISCPTKCSQRFGRPSATRVSISSLPICPASLCRLSITKSCCSLCCDESL